MDSRGGVQQKTKKELSGGVLESTNAETLWHDGVVHTGTLSY